ncbi:MAG TPA: chemotaxis protein CheX [Gemmataceae bacterium]|nr:chemotaxis protein CheX [Gemmataceae bacterium]
MNVGPAEIGQYVESIWDSILGLGVGPGETALPGQKSDYVTGCVQLTGVWEGAVTFDCPTTLARRAAGILFGTKPDETTTAELYDVVGELTNMMGGNLKALLPSPCYLSLPTVADGSDYALRILGTRVVSRAGFQCEDQPFLVTVIERLPKGERR